VYFTPIIRPFLGHILTVQCSVCLIWKQDPRWVWSYDIGCEAPDPTQVYSRACVCSVLGLVFRLGFISHFITVKIMFSITKNISYLHWACGRDLEFITIHYLKSLIENRTTKVVLNVLSTRLPFPVNMKVQWII
jgi:hypothetical protein